MMRYLFLLVTIIKHFHIDNKTNIYFFVDIILMPFMGSLHLYNTKELFKLNDSFDAPYVLMKFHQHTVF